MIKIKALKVLENKSRISSIDLFRGIAIISVVLFHYNTFLPYGYLGVDLFFVISGLLIGGILIREFDEFGKINFRRFILQRGGKIWPSYYSFLFFGTLLAILFYQNTELSNQIIPFKDLSRYLFFYRNYTGFPQHWSFDHVWSICIEEHFYFIFPLLFIFFRNVLIRNRKVLFLFIIGTIALGIVFKYLSFYLTNSKDTYAATHNRIDALAWGILVSLLVSFSSFKKKKKQLLCIAIGLVSLILLIYLHINFKNEIFHKIWFHSLIPISMSLLLLGFYHMRIQGFVFLRLIAYYSYNWYLWHPIFVFYITKKMGDTISGLLLYVFVSFVTAIIATIIVEEPMLKFRNNYLKK